MRTLVATKSTPSSLASAIRLATVILLAVLCFFSTGSRLDAQIGGSGSISGTVTDPSGAVIPNALIVAVNNANGTRVTQHSSGAGAFTLSPLEAGQYTVTIVATGFEKLTQEHIQVNALQIVGLKPQLTLGVSTETVTVEGAPPQLDTQNASIGGTMENAEYVALPLQINGGARNPTSFVYLEPGVAHGGSGVQTGIFSGTGSAGRLDEVYIDGFPQTSIYEQGDPRYVSNLVSVEAVDQFQVITSNPPAAYQGVGLENYTIRSGSNKIHGSVFDYYRDTSFDTWGFFQPNVINPLLGHATKPNEHQSEYGVSLSGPIKKDKIFLFANYDGFYLHKDNNPTYSTIPTLAMRSGDFSQFLTLATPQAIYDPTSCPTGSQSAGTCTRTQFAYNNQPNVINPARIGAAETFMQKFQPTPINSNITNNYLSQIPSFQHHFSTMEHLDWTINDRQRFSVIFGAQLGAVYGFQSNGSNPGPLPYTSGQGFETKNKLIQAEHTFTINQHLVNQFKAGYTRFWGPVFNPDYRTPGFGLGTNAGVTGLPGGQASGSFPTVTWAGNNPLTQWSGDQDYNDITNYATILDNVQYIKGKHTFTFGGTHQWLEVQDIAYTTGISPVTLTYSNSQTALYTNKTGISSTGHSYASFLIGQVNQGSLTQQSFIDTGARIQPSSLYAQDDYKLTSKLTLNIGLRWDYYPAYREVINRSTFLNINATNPITGNKGALEYAGSGTGPYCNCNTPVNSWYKNFGPRLGFAYSVAPGTVIRGGYAIAYTHGSGTRSALFKGTGTVGLSSAPSIVSKTSGDAAFLLDSGFPAYTAPPTINAGYGTFYTTLSNTPASSMSYPDPYLGSRAPYANMYNLGIEQQLTKDMAVQINYVGSQGHFLPVSASGARGYFSNQLNPQYLKLGSLLGTTVTPAVIAQAQQVFPGIQLPYASFSGTLAQALVPFPQYSGVSDTYDNLVNSNYNSLQFIIKQRMSRDIDFMFNYTWSAEIDDNGTFRSGYLSNRVERGRGTADVPNVINSTAIVKLPFGKGQPLHSNNRFLNSLMSDFSLSAIYTYSSGIPLAIISSGCVAPGTGQCMPNYNPNYTGSKVRINGSYGQGVTAATAATTHYIDINGFIDPSAATSSTATAAQKAAYPNYTIGNVARTAPYGLRGPTAFDGDVSLKRTITLHDNVNLLLDVSAYNITNSVILAAPGVSTSTPSTFGVSSSQSNLSRDIQLAARINF
ncbi:TonB-dependent receptor [Granulicella tundricola]|uniref:TonB-dependent transporter Oar-like beta-barrel domain-containing protein n=1 Tax=Granulicella tundricola (strain ATCC BAA-1859 / DSM 23138 / MP5ACTX9) TaxID=1198114 RepID=E8X414_GRATM|nr:TonB-dependent receptor [Granulicella tundricola]ADW70522.1 hypothetical protein AciX9_3517 [Granulicella tundricola MP5ACTX9]